MMAGLCVFNDQAIGLNLALACVPMCGLLILGGLYWRAKLHQLDGKRDTLNQVLGQAVRWRMPLLATSLAAIVLAIMAWTSGLSASTGERWAVTIAAILAALEYVNYYHRQLQHFDHWPDFQRLVSGRGFQPSQMATDLKRFQAKEGASSIADLK